VALGLKHGLDRIAAGCALVVLLPLFVVIAVAILLDSGRPVLVRQWRAGKDGRSFLMYKFRTMVPDAVELGRQLRLSEDPFGVVANDPRITKSGRFLRRTGLDELPQLFNVVRGQMSLVGPRADLVHQAANYAPRERRRLSVLVRTVGEIFRAEPRPVEDRMNIERARAKDLSKR
jgi:lipopolysaccharide/colanic/teichoic acid biosynthesis glycosyltransferase